MKRFLAAVLFGFAASVWAVDTTRFTFDLVGGQSTVEIPTDLADLVRQNQAAIQHALTATGVTQHDFDAAMDVVNDQYESLFEDGIRNPYTTAIDGLDDFCDDLCDTIPNTQVLQNMWAQSWIGMLIPNVHFGLGVNAGVAMLDVTSLKTVAEALNIDAGDLPDNLVFPTATLDLRLGGIVLPFDIGFTIMSLDTSNISSLDDALDPCGFQYFSIGGDIRYKLIDVGGKHFNARISASAGGYFTKGTVDVEDGGSKSSVSMDFKSTTLFIGAQASAKALCLIPFLGTRVAFTKCSVDWEADADWNGILDGGDEIAQVMSWGILPTHFEGDSDSGWKVRPQVYGGLGFDLFVIDLTVSASYDIVSGIPGGAVSVRLSI